MALRQRVKQKITENLLSQALLVLGYSPEGSYRLLVKAFDRIAVTEQHKMIASWLCDWFARGNPGALWLSQALRRLHPNVRKNYIAKTIVDIFFRDPGIFAQYKKEHGFRPPSIMLVSPTMRCNYRCAGCYAANYIRDDDLPPELFNRVLNEAKELTTKFFVILGGEPFVYKPLLDIFERHNDAPLTGGCISGARTYFHINHKGDVEPCIFVHFATDNIKDTPLVKALNSPFFKGLRTMEPFCYNTLRPCPIIDHPKLMRMAIEKYGAYPTHEGAESLLSSYIAEGLDCYAQGVEEVFDPVWDREYADWAERWTAAMDFPEGRVETRKAGYRLSREKEKAEAPIPR